jgi:DNA-directed RNA polymerase subunit H (RpoH/RPB5)
MAGAQLSPELCAYKHLRAFVEFRGLVLKDEPLCPDSAEKVQGYAPAEVVSTMLDKFGHWKCVLADKARPDRTTVVHVVPGTSKYLETSARFRALLASSQQSVGEGETLVEVISILPEESLKKVWMASIAEAFPSTGGEDGVLYNIYPNCVFAREVPRDPLVPRHSIYPKAEAQKLLDYFHTTAGDLEEIRARTDAMAIWLGARPGDYVRVDRISETARDAFTLRYAV